MIYNLDDTYYVYSRSLIETCLKFVSPSYLLLAVSVVLMDLKSIDSKVQAQLNATIQALKKARKSAPNVVLLDRKKS